MAVRELGPLPIINLGYSLSSFVDTGVYQQPSEPSSVYYQLDYPVREQGLLEVFRGNGYAWQRYTTDTNAVYYRAGDGTSIGWGAWQRLASAGDLTAEVQRHRPILYRWDFPATTIAAGSPAVRPFDQVITAPLPTAGTVLVTWSIKAHVACTANNGRPAIILTIINVNDTVTHARWEDVQTSPVANTGEARQAEGRVVLPADQDFRVVFTLLNRNSSGGVSIVGSSSTDYGLLHVEPGVTP